MRQLSSKQAPLIPIGEWSSDCSWTLQLIVNNRGIVTHAICTAERASQPWDWWPEVDRALEPSEGLVPQLRQLVIDTAAEGTVRRSQHPDAPAPARGVIQPPARRGRRAVGRRPHSPLRREGYPPQDDFSA